ncbi:MAG: glycosyltransferase family 39 protein [Chloroflexi bacterium]|nr:glycosyltransferase family 39 protein [Chloroflexota bacterium]
MNNQQSEIRNPQFTIEAALYVLIGAVALVLRLANLGAPPLLVSEARDALAVYRYTMSMGVPLSTLGPAWFALTSLCFTLFGSSEFWARFIPTIAGTVIVFTPLVFRKEIGRLAALAASAFLAISAVAVASSRYADGTTLAALSLLLIVIRNRLAQKNAEF